MLKTILSILFATIFLLVSSPNLPSNAQEPRVILPFITVSGVLDADTPSKDWFFEAEQSQTISVIATATEGDLDIVVEFLTENGQLLAANDNANYETTNARIEMLPLPNEGNYIVRVSRAGLENGNTSGAYTLDLVYGYSIHDDSQATVSVAGTGTQSIGTIANAPFLVDLDIIMPDVADTYMLEWRLSDPTGVTWVFQHFITGIWVLELENAEGIVIRTINSDSELLPSSSNTTNIVFHRDETTFAVFFNQELLVQTDVIQDLEQVGSGELTIVINEPDAPLALLEDIRITTGFYQGLAFDNGAMPPSSILLYDYADVPIVAMRELRDRELVPPPSDNSGLQGDISESFILNDAASFNAYPLIERPFRNFVLSYAATITTGSETGACGIIFRQVSLETFATVLFTPQRGLYVVQYEGGDYNSNAVSSVSPYLLPNLDVTNHFMLIVIDNQVQLFVNGYLAETVEILDAAGLTRSHLVLDEDIVTYCRFDEIWLWVLD